MDLVVGMKTEPADSWVPNTLREHRQGRGLWVGGGGMDLGHVEGEKPMRHSELF